LQQRLAEEEAKDKEDDDNNSMKFSASILQRR
jgi:hypothetical protein